MKFLKYYILASLILVFLDCNSEITPEMLKKLLKVEVISSEEASVNENFNVLYKLSYTASQKLSYDLKPELSKEDNKNVKLLYFSRTNQSTSMRTISGHIEMIVEEIWTATFKPLKKGKFILPSFKITATPQVLGEKAFSIDVPQEKRVIKIVSEVKSNNNKAHNSGKADVKKIEKEQPVFLYIELPSGDFTVGETVTAKIYVLLKNLDMKYDIENALIDRKIKIKNADFKFISVDNAKLHPIELDGITYRGALVELLEITPLKTGEITIPKIKLEGVGHLLSPNSYWGLMPGEKFKFNSKSSPVTFIVTEKKSHPSPNPDGLWL